MPIDSSRLAEAQQLIIEFREKFHAVMSQGGSANSIYHLGIQLIPLTVETREDGLPSRNTDA